MKHMRLCAVALALTIAAAVLRWTLPSLPRPETLLMATLPSRLGPFVRYGTSQVECDLNNCNLRHWSRPPSVSAPFRTQCPLCSIGIDHSGETPSDRSGVNEAARYVCVRGGSVMVVNLAVLRTVGPDPIVLEPLMPLNHRGWFHDSEMQSKISEMDLENGAFRWVAMRRLMIAASSPIPPPKGEFLVCLYGFGSPHVSGASRWGYLMRHYQKRLATGRFRPVQTVIAWVSITPGDDRRLARFAAFAEALATSVIE